MLMIVVFAIIVCRIVVSVDDIVIIVVCINVFADSGVNANVVVIDDDVVTIVCSVVSCAVDIAGVVYVLYCVGGVVTVTTDIDIYNISIDINAVVVVRAAVVAGVMLLMLLMYVWFICVMTLMLSPCYCRWCCC